MEQEASCNMSEMSTASKVSEISEEISEDNEENNLSLEDPNEFRIEIKSVKRELKELTALVAINNEKSQKNV